MKICSETDITDLFHAYGRMDRVLVLGTKQEYQRLKTQDTYI
jgi:hypothetical protein